MTIRLDQGFVEAELDYLKPTIGRPRYQYYSTDGETPRRPEVEMRRVRIHDMRPLAPELDRNGFALVRKPSAMRNFWDPEEVRRVYYPEATALVTALTGARRAEIFDHVHRHGAPAAQRRDGSVEPARQVHVDRSSGTIGSGFLWRSMRRTRVERTRAMFGEGAAASLDGRIQVITLWRPIVGPLRDTPLALCDARTVDRADLVPSDLVYRDRVAESYSVTYNPAHAWYYAPDMQPDEALLIKCSDTLGDGCTQFTPHAAFTDPTTPADAPPRESIEVRMLVFHEA